MTLRMNYSPAMAHDADDLRELLDRFDYEIETCKENIADTSDRSERGYWLGRLRSAQCFLKKYSWASKK